MRNGFCPTSLVQAGEPGERLPLKCCLLGVGSWRAQPKDGCSLEQPLASTLSIPQVPPSQLSKLLLFLSCSFLHMQIIPILTGSFTGVRVCSKSWGRVCWNHHSRVQQMLVCSSDEIILSRLGWSSACTPGHFFTLCPGFSSNQGRKSKKGKGGGQGDVSTSHRPPPKSASTV